MACGSSGFGLLMFLLLRVVPLRMLAAAIEHATFLSALRPADVCRTAACSTSGSSRPLLTHDAKPAKSESDMDLDHFKTINDLFGHPAGDATLRTVAERLRKCLRAGDTLARLGGDEFAVIQHSLMTAEDADALGKRMLAAVEPPIDLNGQFQHVGISIGVTLSEVGAPNLPDELIKQADIALYQAKEVDVAGPLFFSGHECEAPRASHLGN